LYQAEPPTKNKEAMALIKCSECGKDVSDKAASCPHCGAPLLPAARRAARPWEVVGTLLVIGGVIASVAGSEYGLFALLGGFVIFLIGRFKG
jgi:DNA-directed RNA polymerase subunit RPC12/RpoP